MKRIPALMAAAFVCSPLAHAESFTITGSDGVELEATVLETFDRPWSMTYLPDGRALVAEKAGTLWLLGTNGRKLAEIDNAPSVSMRGQGGLGDVIVDPDFASNGTVYLSYVERDPKDDDFSGAAVERATLRLTARGGALLDRKVIWRQSPKMTGNGHYGHRLAVSPDGYLFITSGERQKFNPAQNMAMNLGKVIRLHPDGRVPEDNPFHGSGGVADQVWTLGHRNPLGMAFDGDGQLWVHEMGPRHGDELNRIVRGENYGYPFVSEGEHYDGTPIPSHDDIPTYEKPTKAWVPAISPAGFAIYDGNLFEAWKGDGLIGGMSSQALVRVEFGKETTGSGSRVRTKIVAEEAARYEWGKRVREVEQGPDGAIMVLEDKTGGRLLALTPAN